MPLPLFALAIAVGTGLAVRHFVRSHRVLKAAAAFGETILDATKPHGDVTTSKHQTAMRFSSGPERYTEYRRYEYSFGNQSEAMDRVDALEMLGFTENDPPPDAAAVKRRYRELMSRFHVDVGGSSLLSQKLNDARDTLLGGPK